MPVDVQALREEAGVAALAASESARGRRGARSAVETARDLDADVRRRRRERDGERRALRVAQQAAREDRALREALPGMKARLKELDGELAEAEARLDAAVAGFGNVVKADAASGLREAWVAAQAAPASGPLPAVSGAALGARALVVRAIAEAVEDAKRVGALGESQGLAGRWLDETRELPIVFINGGGDELRVWCAGDDRVSGFVAQQLVAALGAVLGGVADQVDVPREVAPNELPLSCTNAARIATRRGVVLATVLCLGDFESRGLGVRSGPKKMQSIHERKKYVHEVAVQLTEAAQWAAWAASGCLAAVPPLRLTPASWKERVAEHVASSRLQQADDQQRQVQAPPVVGAHGEPVDAHDLERLERWLRDQSFLAGPAPGRADLEAWRLVLASPLAPTPVQYPHVTRWLAAAGRAPPNAAK